MQKYLQWLQSNGCIFDKIEFPAFFGQVCGVRASQDILPQEAIAFIPNKLIISVESARQSEIGYIFKSHDSLFVANVDRDFLIIVLYVIYEKGKGDKSFWNTYLDVIEPGKPACFWDADVLTHIDCPELNKNLKSN